MVVTEGSLYFLGGLATLATLGLFLEYADRWTEILVEFAAAMLWGVFGLSSFDVLVRPEVAGSESQAIDPLVYLGFGLAGLIAIYAFNDLLTGVREEARDANLAGLFR